MPAFKTSITRDGPFFRVDPRATFRANVRRLIAAVVAEGERDVQGQLRVGEAGRAPVRGVGRVADHVVGRTKAITGREWEVSGVVSVNTAGMTRAHAVATRAAAARIEARNHAFRRTKGRLRRARAVNIDELLRGLR